MRSNTEKKDKLRVGVVGLGKMGILHSALLNMNPQAELVAVQDSNAQLSKYVRDSNLKVQFFTDIDEMLESISLDASFICTPTFTHFPISERCFQKDLDIFVEKPLAESLQTAQKMIGFLSRKDFINGIGFQFAYIRVFQEAKRLLENEILGTLFRFRASQYLSLLSGKKKGWIFDKSKAGGGIVVETAVHLLFLLYWYFGLPSNIYAKTVNKYMEVEDSASMLFEYPSRLIGLVDVSWSRPGYRLSAIKVIVEGKNGTLEIADEYLKLNLYRKAGEFQKGWTTIHKIDLGSTASFDLGGEGYYDENSEFVECCLKKTSPSVTWKDGFEVQKIIETIYSSAASGKPINPNEV